MASIDLTPKELTVLKNLVHQNISLLVAFENNHAPDKFAELWTINREIMEKINYVMDNGIKFNLTPEQVKSL